MGTGKFDHLFFFYNIIFLLKTNHNNSANSSHGNKEDQTGPDRSAKSILDSGAIYPEATNPGEMYLKRYTLGCTRRYWAVVDCTVCWAVLDCTGHYWDVLGGTELYWAVLGCTGHYWAVLGGNGLYWAVLGCGGVGLMSLQMIHDAFMPVHM